MQQLCEPREAAFDPVAPLGDTVLLVDQHHPLTDPALLAGDDDGDPLSTTRRHEFNLRGVPAEGFVKITLIDDDRLRINLCNWQYRCPEAQAVESMSLTKIEEAAIEQAFGRRV
jgi:hypothetical protein